MRPPRPAQPSAYGAERHSPNVVTLDAASIEAIAQRVSELLQAAPPAVAPRFVSAAELARILGVSRDTVYEHSDELGGVKIGKGRRARIRFDADAALAAFCAGKGPQEHEDPANEPITRRRRRRSAGTEPGLLPVGGQKPRREGAKRGTNAA